MTRNVSVAAIGIVLAVVAGAVAAQRGDGGADRATADVAITGHPDPLSLLAHDDPELARNKRLVFDMWRSIVNGGHVELADEMLHEECTQHSPVLPTGREAFKQIFSAVPRLDEISRARADAARRRCRDTGGRWSAAGDWHSRYGPA